MPKRTNIVDMNVGETYSHIFLLKQHAVKQTKNNTNYLDLVFMDKTGEMPGKMWAIPATLDTDSLQDSDFIVLQFTVEDYQGTKQAKITNIRLVRPTDEFNKEELIPVAPEPAQDMYDEIMDTVQKFSNETLKSIVSTALVENKDKLLSLPGAKAMHHAVLGGLLYHTLGMLRTAKAISGVYETINKDLLYSGVILHDIAKILEYETGPVGLVTDYTTEGKLLGHINMGANYIADLCKRLEVSDAEIPMLLQHMVLSHHGVPEHGSAITPMFLEAQILYVCDYVDSRVYMFNEATKDIEAGTFSQKVFGLDNKQIYKPMLKSTENNFTMDLDDEGLY